MVPSPDRNSGRRAGAGITAAMGAADGTTAAAEEAAASSQRAATEGFLGGVQHVELQLGPSDRRCTLSCIWESKSSVDQACKTENDDYKLGANADSRYKKGIAERSTAL